MNPISLGAYEAEIFCENENTDAVLHTEQDAEGLRVFLTADQSRPEAVVLRWPADTGEHILALGDAWERSYGDLSFKRLAENTRWMPWYFIATNGTDAVCMGVKTQPNAFVAFRYDANGLEARLDVRNGGGGVSLGGRTLCLATFITKTYKNTDDFDALCDFCGRLCDAPILPDAPVYGGNNWYYAYGNSSFAEIDADAAVMETLSDGIANPAFEVVDDGWQIHSCAGPWIPNEKFRDMKKLSDRIHARGLRSGIWLRPLYTRDAAIPDDMKILRDGRREYLDPTDPRAQALIRADIARIRDWGYDLIKHDFTTCDLFGSWGKDLTDGITNSRDWHFADRTKTNAEITLDLYRLIKDACGDMLIIGCNTVPHLCAGLVQICRTGDDTSGREWSRTVGMGVNTLAFRLAQNRKFYLVDADCVGILGDAIPWSKNRQWLDLLSKSDTALFVSCNNTVSAQMRRDIASAFREIQKTHKIKPLDRCDAATPRMWQIDEKTTEYDW